MTAIEFYDRTPMENVISALTVVPDKIVFIGENSQMKNFHQIYRRFLENRHLQIEVEYKGINRHDIMGIAQTLSAIVEQEDECLIDLTGGDDLVLVAMGMVFQKYRDSKNIQMQRFNVLNGRVTDCDNDGNQMYAGNPTLSVAELVQLHGGAVRTGDITQDYTYAWDLSTGFVEDVELMWGLCRDNPGLWNICMTAIGKSSPKADGSLAVAASLPRLESYLLEISANVDEVFELLRSLQRYGLITDLCTDGQTLSYLCKDAQVKKCLEKAGTVLEMKVLITAQQVLEKDGTPYYTDAVNGVRIDWDGEFHGRYDTVKDTDNEIDVVLMKGLLPVFVSCKNGGVEDDELYKLDAVTDRFGGVYAKKVLVATYLNKGQDSLRYFRQRASDMGIKFVEGVHLLDDNGFRDMVKRLIYTQ